MLAAKFALADLTSPLILLFALIDLSTIFIAILFKGLHRADWQRMGFPSLVGEYFFPHWGVFSQGCLSVLPTGEFLNTIVCLLRVQACIFPFYFAFPSHSVFVTALYKLKLD